METYWGIVSVFYLPKTKSVQEGNSIVRVYKPVCACNVKWTLIYGKNRE